MKLFFTVARCAKFGPLCRRFFSVSGDTMTDVYRAIENRIGNEWVLDVPKYICETVDKVFMEH